MRKILLILSLVGVIVGVASIAFSSPPAEVEKKAASPTTEREAAKKLSVELGKRELVLTSLKVPFPEKK